MDSMSKRKQTSRPASANAEPESVRRRLAEAFRRRADDPALTATEQVEFARMADAWERTLPTKPKAGCKNILDEQQG